MKYMSSSLRRCAWGMLTAFMILAMAFSLGTLVLAQDGEPTGCTRPSCGRNGDADCGASCHCGPQGGEVDDMCYKK